ncbi:hypothetical protein EX30DRAFT_350746 [Ascodesmis nigricans]|uniref:Uncharacterized protein n=1 Tax=Ascodesmis nigricans TaxID=341454 RepID=A0A4S2MSJ0_9PEZI|nr:hypothetical protein EX30DRAFT_350746 [Ascodesmis nigricans]
MGFRKPEKTEKMKDKKKLPRLHLENARPGTPKRVRQRSKVERAVAKGGAECDRTGRGEAGKNGGHEGDRWNEEESVVVKDYRTEKRQRDGRMGRRFSVWTSIEFLLCFLFRQIPSFELVGLYLGSVENTGWGVTSVESQDVGCGNGEVEKSWGSSRSVGVELEVYSEDDEWIDTGSNKKVNDTS